MSLPIAIPQATVVNTSERHHRFGVIFIPSHPGTLQASSMFHTAIPSGLTHSRSPTRGTRDNLSLRYICQHDRAVISRPGVWLRCDGGEDNSPAEPTSPANPVSIHIPAKGVSTWLHQPRYIAYHSMVEDYPKTLMELERRFSDDAACREYLASLRWPKGFVCPGCRGRQGLAIRRGLWRAKHVGGRHRLLQEQFFRTVSCRWWYGSARYGRLPAKKTA